MADYRLEWNGEEILEATNSVAAKVSKEIAKDVMKDAKAILKRKATTTTEKGLLKQFYVDKSKFKNGGYLVYCQGPKKWWKPYHACVLGYDTWVKTDKGHKEIGGIKAGDYVIGQDGLPHKVNYISSFYATEKPNLVELEVEFMKTKNHKLIVTTDHKILTIKNGVSYWIKAGDLKENDFVFTAIKKAHNQSKYTGEIKTCQCNDSMNSFINLDYFKSAKVIKTTKFKYLPKRGKGKKLYDLSVENVHSFIASGVVVSNSFVEMGSWVHPYGNKKLPKVYLPPKPFMRPAASKNRRSAEKLYQEKINKAMEDLKL